MHKTRRYENYHVFLKYHSIKPFLEFEPEIIYSKSQAAAGLCSWVRNIMVFHYINETVKPLRAALAQANAELKAAMDHLHALQARLAVKFLSTFIICIAMYAHRVFGNR